MEIYKATKALELPQYLKKRLCYQLFGGTSYSDTKNL